MLESKGKNRPLFAILRNWIVPSTTVALALTVGSAQEMPLVPPFLHGIAQAQSPAFHVPSVLAGPFVTASTIAAEVTSAGDSTAGQPVRSGQQHRITLEQVKQQSANRAMSPLVSMSRYSVEAAKQHRLGVQADYFPKFSATFMNLHTTDFLGQIVQVRHPIEGVVTQIPVQIINQNQTLAALTFVQPITPLLAVRQAVRIARADERIAMAKAAGAISRNGRDTEIEAAYFNLLIAQRQLTSAEWKLRSGAPRQLYASISTDVARTSQPEAGTMESRMAVETAAAKVKELTASLNRVMGWPEDTQLELAVPDPLVENISLQDVADKSTAANPALVEAEQTVVKARAAHSLSKMAYFPVVAAVSGYTFQNILPAVNSNFGYGGVMASYTLFDFGKREHAVKEARAQLGMAETALQLTKAKLAGDVKKSYFELERSRQLSQVAQKMGSSATLLVKASADSESPEIKAARADVELEMLEADFAHRQALNRLKALIGQDR